MKERKKIKKEGEVKEDGNRNEEDRKSRRVKREEEN